jgi:hypothetical protein
MLIEHMDVIAFGFTAFCAINSILAIRRLLRKRRGLKYSEEQFTQLDL